ncbi:hypothetical protein QPK24_22420 [Paenibacillus polygoni]|uniref:Uncharacterized protein n=1 Tax=Paenibacillus polygoni TaxID=3050112 RepID=A0ABY8X0X3_9BACL|nr:hypothetical protein [Paenibacillus polygoni]WIV19040.1 hypothetical protein QPK24_22420 [Paenibacillus polygoni]
MTDHHPNNHQPNNKNTPPQEGRSVSPTASIAKVALYTSVTIVIAFVLVSLFSSIGFNIIVITLNLSTPIQWTTLYILPWIFLYYFIQFVRAFVKGKQG